MQMRKCDFNITEDILRNLLKNHPNMGKNSHVGYVAVKIVELYFKSLDSNVHFSKGTKGADLEVNYLGLTEYFEIKGTADPNICWQKLKVSSQTCHDALKNGMTLIRVVNVGTLTPILYFMKYGEDFNLIPEPRWAVTQIKKQHIC